LERSPAAILVADVVGHTRPLARDETGTLRRFTEPRQEILEPLIADNNGRIVNLMGDGLQVEFPSGAGAIACANGWRGKDSQDQAVCYEGSRLGFRKGVNIGDLNRLQRA